MVSFCGVDLDTRTTFSIVVLSQEKTVDIIMSSRIMRIIMKRYGRGRQWHITHFLWLTWTAVREEVLTAEDLETMM